MVATDILLTKNAFVEKTLNVGTNAVGNARVTIFGNSDTPYISIGQGTVSSVDGSVTNQGYDLDNIFLGIATINSVKKPALSLKSSTNYLK
jgi:hypothetical protein